MKEGPQKPRPFQFSIRTVLILMLTACVLAAIAGSIKRDIEIEGAEKYWLLLTKVAAGILAPILALIIVIAEAGIDWPSRKKTKKEKRKKRSK